MFELAMKPIIKSLLCGILIDNNLQQFLDSLRLARLPQHSQGGRNEKGCLRIWIQVPVHVP